MAYHFTNSELVNMIMIYGECLQNSQAARRRYSELFPNRHLPFAPTFIAVVQRARYTGELQPRRRDTGPGRGENLLAAEEEILEAVENDPTLSTRHLAHRFNVSQFVVWRTLREAQLNPFTTDECKH